MRITGIYSSPPPDDILAAAGHSHWAEFSSKSGDLLVQIEKATKSFVTETVNINNAHTKDGRHVRGKVRSAGGYYIAELEIADHPDELIFFAA
jgi:hypothetical protein